MSEYDLEIDSAMSPQGDEQTRAMGARAGYAAAVDTNPDEYAKANSLAKQAGVPVQTAQNMPVEVKRRAAVQAVDFDAIALTSPSTAELLRDVHKAKLAHDDVENLTETEYLVNSAKAGWKDLKANTRMTQARANADTVQSIRRVEAMIVDGVDPNAIKADVDPLGVASWTPEQRAQLLSESEIGGRAQAQSAQDNMAAAAQIPQHPALDRIAKAGDGYEGFGTIIPTIKEFAQSPVSAIANWGVRSAVGQAPSLAATMGAGVLGKPLLAMMTAAGGSYATDYASGLGEFLRDEKGLDIKQPGALFDSLSDPDTLKAAGQAAHSHALPVAAIDALSFGVAGKMTLPKFLDKALEGKPLMKEVVNALVIQPQVQGAMGGVGEFLGQTASGQDINFANILAEWAGEHFGAPAEVVSASWGRIKEDYAKAKSAEEHTQVLSDLNDLTKASKVLERDPETFAEFINQVAPDESSPNLYIDANVLAQTGMAEDLAAISPSIAEQYEAAIESGGQIRIPMAEYATSIAPSEYAQTLLEHIKTDEDGFSLKEASDFMEAKGEALRQQIEDTLTAHTGDQAFKDSINTVKQSVMTELTTTGRFTDKVNDAYASLVSSFYGVMAAKMGISPEQLYQDKPLLVRSKGGVGSVYAQSAKVDQQISQWGEGKLDSQTILDLGRPSSVLRQFGLSDLPIQLAQNILKKAKNKHKVQPDDLKGLALAVQNPLAVFKSKKGEGHLVVLTELQHDHGNITVAIDLNVARNKIDIHDIRSVHPKRDEGVRWWVEEGLLLGHKKDKGVAWFEAGAQSNSALDQTKKALTNSIVYDEDAQYNQDTLGTFNPDTLTTTLLAKANLSTFLHESGHFFLEMHFGMAQSLTASGVAFEDMTPGQQEVIRDANKVLEWFGIRDLAEWDNLSFEEKTSYHEKYAESFEHYLFSGKAPSIELQGHFQNFRAWMLNVYTSLKNFLIGHPEAGTITPEVSQVFDRMLATNEQIALAEQARSQMPLFMSPEQAGMTPEKFAEYHAQGIQHTQDAIQDLQARGLRDLQWIARAKGREVGRLQKESASRRAEITMEVRGEVMSQPIYRAWQFLKGKADPNIEGDELNYGKLKLSDLKDMGYPKMMIDLLVERRMTSDERGVHPDVVSEMFGFTSGDELVRGLAEAQDPNVEIEGLVDAKMLEQYGELATPEAIEQAADKAIHNEARARMIATEIAALERAMGATEATGRTNRAGKPIKRSILPAAAKAFAAEMVNRLKIRNIRPGQYANAEARAGKAAQKAFKAGDVELAMAEKRNELVQNFATKAAYDAKEAVEKALSYLNKFSSSGVRKALDVEYLSRIDALLEKYDLRKQSGTDIDRTRSMRQWVQSQLNAGKIPEISESLLSPSERAEYLAEVQSRDEYGELVYADDDERIKLLAEAIDRSAKTSYKELTVEQFQGLVDTVKQIEHLGRLKNKLLTANAHETYEGIRDAIVEGITANARQDGKNTRTPSDWLGKKLQSIYRFGVDHIRAATWAQIMDGGQIDGPVWHYLIKPANDRATQETTMRAETTKALDDILRPILKKVPAMDKSGKGTYFASINDSLNWQSRFAILLNMGNESNMARLLDGKGWTLAQIKPILDTFTAEEILAAQKIWDHFESFRPAIAEKELRVNGKEPEWIKPRQITFHTSDDQHVTLRGGYYPVKFDARVNLKAGQHAAAEEAKNQMKAAYSAATTSRSFTKSRVEEVKGRPLLLDLTALYSGLNDVIHDLAWHEWAIDANKLLGSKTIDSAIREHYGANVKDSLTKWRDDVIGGSKQNDKSMEMLSAFVRQNVSLSSLAFNLVSAVSQPLGLANSIARLGETWIIKGVSRYLSNPVKAARDARAMSEWMNNRSRTRFKELNELRNQVQGVGSFKDSVGRYGYYLMLKSQTMVDTITWWGGYERAMSEGHSEDVATAFADQSVKDSQGGGEEVDQSGLERGGAVTKLFTVFYGFMGTALNTGYMSQETSSSKARTVANWIGITVVPAVLMTIIKEALVGGGEDKWEKLPKKLAIESVASVLGLMVGTRELVPVFQAFAGEGFGYQGPAGLRPITDAYKLGTQIHQGDFDLALAKAAISLTGDFTGLPSVQINRMLTGSQAMSEGKTSNPTSLLFGFNAK